MCVCVCVVGIQAARTELQLESEEKAVDSFVRTYIQHNNITSTTKWTVDRHNSLVSAAAQNIPPISMLTDTLILRIKHTVKQQTDTHTEIHTHTDTHTI